ncbi:MAG: hypothetical protein ACREFY_07040, partial [Acetobacteraceae bacterium]
GGPIFVSTSGPIFIVTDRHQHRFSGTLWRRCLYRPKPGKERGRTATNIHARWLRGTVGITDRRKAPAHSWRHRMEDELRKVRALPEVQDALTGRHNPRNAGAGYGKGFRGMPWETVKELAKIANPMKFKRSDTAPAESHVSDN